MNSRQGARRMAQMCQNADIMGSNSSGSPYPSEKTIPSMG
jgi:hypothetical protein